ncbi:MAG: molybdate ABC transporter permease subunit [Phormidesmis sp.]
MLDFSPLWISLRIAAIATFITVFLGTAAAHFMQRCRGRVRSLLDSLFLAPLVLPPTVLGFLLLLLLGKNGPFGKVLSNLGISVVFTWYAAVLTATVVAFPLMYKTTLGAFEQIDTNLQQAARTLGASELTVFYRITLPLSLPSLLAGTTLAFARALGEFGATLMLAGNIPGRTQTLPMAIYFAVEGGDFHEAALWTFVILTLSLGAVVVVNQFAHQKNFLSGNPHFSFKSQKEKKNPSPTQPTISVPSDPHSLTFKLEVDIRKQLPGFDLAVKFVASDQRPLGLLGASGAGKSLILRCLAGIETPDAGRIVLNGRVLFDSVAGIDLPSCDRKVGILFQNYALFPHLTIAQNVAFGLPHHLRSPNHLQAIVSQQLAAVHLDGLAQRYPHELSGGQQQRVALARALASQPEILLLDEPFSALDTHLRSQIEQQLITRLQHYQGMTLLVTHNLEEAYRLCHSLLVLKSGRAVAYSPKHHIFEQPKTVSIAKLTGCKNFSPAVAHGPNTVAASRWHCTLTTLAPLPKNLAEIGIRAHHISFLAPTAPATANTFCGWLAATSETPHRMTLFIKLHTPPAHKSDYHLQAEVLKEKWLLIKDHPFPWQVCLEASRLILLEAD